jgi:hypothetical protein
MATDYAEKEREFLAGLEGDTGHDLAGWMTLIDQQSLAHRNDIIDWLRTQGFHFSWASWLERIHHNGGRPIYVTAAGTAPSAAAMPLPAARPGPAAQPQAQVQPQSHSRPMSAPAPPPPQPTPAPYSPRTIDAVSAPGDLAELLSKAKAYRMLADHLIREVRRVMPQVTIAARNGYVSFGEPLEFAALAISSKELRLGIALGMDTEIGALPLGRMSGTAAPISHVGVLTDARQVNAGLIEALRMAGRRINAS